MLVRIAGFCPRFLHATVLCDSAPAHPSSTSGRTKSYSRLACYLFLIPCRVYTKLVCILFALFTVVHFLLTMSSWLHTVILCIVCFGWKVQSPEARINSKFKLTRIIFGKECLFPRILGGDWDIFSTTRGKGYHTLLLNDSWKELTFFPESGKNSYFPESGENIKFSSNMTDTDTIQIYYLDLPERYVPSRLRDG